MRLSPLVLLLVVSLPVPALAPLVIGCGSGHSGGYGAGDASSDGATGTGGDPSADGGVGEAGGALPANCVPQKEALSSTYCEGRKMERLVVCPDAVPAACKVAAVPNGYCCPPELESTKAVLFSCGRRRTAPGVYGEYYHQAFVELRTFSGYEGVKVVLLGELPKSAATFSASSVTGSLLTSSNMVGVGSSSSFEWWASFKGPITFFSSTISAGNDLPVRKTSSSTCGEIGGTRCVIQDVADGAPLPAFDYQVANKCDLPLYDF